jgi:hypothetical protein
MKALEGADITVKIGIKKDKSAAAGKKKGKKAKLAGDGQIKKAVKRLANTLTSSSTEGVLAIKSKKNKKNKKNGEKKKKSAPVEVVKKVEPAEIEDDDEDDEDEEVEEKEKDTDEEEEEVEEEMSDDDDDQEEEEKEDEKKVEDETKKIKIDQAAVEKVAKRLEQVEPEYLTRFKPVAESFGRRFKGDMSMALAAAIVVLSSANRTEKNGGQEKTTTTITHRDGFTIYSLSLTDDKINNKNFVYPVIKRVLGDEVGNSAICNIAFSKGKKVSCERETFLCFIF